MLSVTLFLIVGLQNSQLETTSGTIITKMFQKYYSAHSLRGSINSESSDEAGTIKFTTEVAFERPAKIYVTQNRKASNGLNYLLVSDGVSFSYDPPRSSAIKPKPYERLYETVAVDRVVEKGTRSYIEKWSHKVGDIFAVGHTSIDFCVALDIIIAHDAHLRDFKTLTSTHKLIGMEDYKGKKVYKITGDWRPRLDAPPTGSYMLLVSQEFDILMFTLKERYQVGARAVNFSLVEICDVRVGEAVPPDLFRVK